MKTPRDLEIARRRHWYRVPLDRAPRRSFGFVAFYQPASFGVAGGRIARYAPVLGTTVTTRRRLLPGESDHPRADQPYLRLRLGPVATLPRPIVNESRLRVSFAFTTLSRLMRERTLSGLLDVPPLEGIVWTALKRARMNPAPEFFLRLPGGLRARLDFAFPCRDGRLDVECDGLKWHSQKRQAARDRARDRALREAGWTVLRLAEGEILNDLPGCVTRIRRAVQALGGPQP